MHDLKRGRMSFSCEFGLCQSNLNTGRIFGFGPELNFQRISS